MNSENCGGYDFLRHARRVFPRYKRGHRTKSNYALAIRGQKVMVMKELLLQALGLNHYLLVRRNRIGTPNELLKILFSYQVQKIKQRIDLFDRER